MPEAFRNRTAQVPARHCLVIRMFVLDGLMTDNVNANYG